MSRPTPTSTSGPNSIYVNGALVVTQNGVIPVATSSVNYLGKTHWVTDSPYVGSIDSFAIFPWALGAADALSLFASDSWVSYSDATMVSSTPCQDIICLNVFNNPYFIIMMFSVFAMGALSI